MNADKLAAILLVVAVLIAIVAGIVSIVTDIKQYKDMHGIRQRIVAFIDAKESPFEATGYIVKRLDDGRFLISFSKPYPELEDDRKLCLDVILSRKDFNAFQSMLIP